MEVRNVLYMAALSSVRFNWGHEEILSTASGKE
jgi:hypothetical protein